VSVSFFWEANCLPYRFSGEADGEGDWFGAFPPRRSRFISLFSSRFCSFFSCFVNSSAGVPAGVDAALGEDVDVVLGAGEPEGIDPTFRG
jgi:hypothetical protein